ncbi:MAG: hypothetical protein NTY86_22940 [Deltaproteobacteria bacterium]|nr:hypothetical protein [Deltaproteobacteria bacterium]
MNSDVEINLLEKTELWIEGVTLQNARDPPGEVTYAIVKSIGQNFGRYGKSVKPMALGKCETMADDIGMPVQLGAWKYYKEKNLIK